MKLLIVDDEELTREGLISSINWKTLGIDSIYQADDGLNGLAVARREKPELILCDVRMPRLNGIQMMERIQKEQPDTVAIFMSGYSDKEYLKAAIKLKAVNYVEKPLNPSEIEEAILDGLKRYQELLSTHRGEAVRSMENAARLAQLLTYPYEQNQEEILSLLNASPGSVATGNSFCTFIVKFFPNEDKDSGTLPCFSEDLTVFLKKLHLKMLHTDKHFQYQIYHIHGNRKPEKSTLEYIAAFFRSYWESSGTFYIAVGESVYGIQNVYRSYASAAFLIQNAFFFDSGEIFYPCPEAETSALIPPQDYSVRFGIAMEKKDKEAVFAVLKEVFDFYYHRRNVLLDQVKDLYYRLASILQENRRSLKLGSRKTPGEESISAFLNRFHTYRELHEALIAHVEQFFLELDSYVPENSTIFLIKDYISKHYAIESLSVKDISAHVHLSASYVCTFFKNETGQTLNQYLTEYRMERAKQLLCDPRYKIAEISSMVGYSDGNYFGKSFKKFTGLSPSEYREQNA